MPSQIALSMLKKRGVKRPGIGIEVRRQIDVGDGDHPHGHPHMEYQHETMDRQHAFDTAVEGLQALEKDNMPGAKELVNHLHKAWNAWQGGGAEPKPMVPATKASHRASPVSKSPVDEQDESLFAPEPDEEFDATKE